MASSRFVPCCCFFSFFLNIFEFLVVSYCLKKLLNRIARSTKNNFKIVNSTWYVKLSTVIFQFVYCTFFPFVFYSYQFALYNVYLYGYNLYFCIVFNLQFVCCHILHYYFLLCCIVLIWFFMWFVIKLFSAVQNFNKEF